jgi:sulfate adenylyltransferase (ADP) / ATP adenylyltransferase
LDRHELPLIPGTLLEAAVRQSERARQSRALEACATTEWTVADGGVSFVVSRAERYPGKSQDNQSQDNQSQADPPQDSEAPCPSADPDSNPFIGYDDDLFVADVSATHVCLLNKFPVMANHLLIVTRTPESQENVLNLEDFEALFIGLAGLGGLGFLGFYNGGRVAGASQPHKHLQLVPLPIGRDGPALPMEPLIAAARAGCLVDAMPGVPFRHAFAWLDPDLKERPLAAAAAAHDVYLGMLDALFPSPAEAPWKRGERQPAPYNLLVTQRWILLVPRAADEFASIPVNALGYAGSFFIWSDEQWDALRAHGPMTVLAAVALPRSQP